jgi:hypothetical protein
MVNIGLRLFDILYEALKKSAAKNQRSLHGEIIHALVEYVRSQGFEIREEDFPIPAKRRA